MAALNAGTYTGVSNADLLTGIRLGLATVQKAGLRLAGWVVLNPADLAAIDLSLMGSTNSGPELEHVGVGSQLHSRFREWPSAPPMWAISAQRCRCSDGPTPRVPDRLTWRLLHQQHRPDPRRDPG